MMPAMSTPVASTALLRARAVAVACLLAMIVLGLAWELVLARTGSGTWALKVLPLAFAFTGLLKLRVYTYRWLSLLVWLYVAEASVRAVTEGGLVRAMALSQGTLALLLFVTCVAFVRARQAEART